MSYTFHTHRHNYAVWTAARAVQRSFTTTANIREAIECSGLRAFAEDDTHSDDTSFEIFHRSCAKDLLNYFNNVGIKATYGRAAKIISIYLKTSVIICNQAACAKSAIIHPPIDRILLQKLAENKGLEKLATQNWTSFDDHEYWELVKMLKEHFQVFNWTLEKDWQV